MTPYRRILSLVSVALLPASLTSLVHAAPLITNVVETGGDDEATDTLVAQWTGATFINGIAGEPIPGSAADAPYTVGLFAEEAPMFVDRNHQWNGATAALPIPKYLEGGEYIMSGNDNRDNADYLLEVTISEACYVYMLIDDRMGDASNANPPNFPDWSLDRNGDGNPDMAWIVEEGWEPVKTGWNRFGNPDWPDHVGVDEGADGVGPGVGINQWSSIYVKRFPAGTFTLRAPDNSGQNMYGAVVKAVPKTPVVTKSGGDLNGFTFEIVDGSVTSVNPASIAVTLNGMGIPSQGAALSITKTGDTTKVAYSHGIMTGRPFPSGSSQQAVLTFSDTATPPASKQETLNFTVENYATLTPALKVAPDTTKPGFLWRVFQNAVNQVNSTQKSEQTVLGQLRGPDGTLLPNQANPNATGTAIGPAAAASPVNALLQFEIAGTINLSQIGGEANGNFPDDGQMPGLPGIEGLDDGVVGEVITYLELPAGVLTMGVNSDDGFETTTGLIQDAAQRQVAGSFSGNRGATDTLFRIFVQEAGVYAFRTLWEEGNGGANLEWFTVGASGQKVLLNDTANGGLKAYRAATVPAPSYVRQAFPLPGGLNVPADAAIVVELIDGSTTVAANSVGLKLNGVTTAPTVTKSGTSTRLELPSSALLPSGSTQSVELIYQTGSESVTNSWSFRVAEYATVSPSGATAVGSGKDRGFRIRTVQSEAARATSVAAAEQQLLNNSGAPNIADLTVAGTDGFFVHPGVINFNQDAPTATGNFNSDNGFEDVAPPGIPGSLGGNDNYAQEILTYLEFPAPGFYTLGVNSDDGFKVTSATGVDALAPTLGVFDGGRGVADSVFNLGIPQAGLYPFRLIWYEGTGGSAAEWFSVTQDGYRLLINADSTGAIKAYQARTVTPTPTIQLAVTPTGLAITYTGVLQSSPSLNGAFADVPGASSPYTTDTAGAARYFRAR